jgi:dCMP deaminase
METKTRRSRAKRPSYEDTFFEIAKTLSRRATCPRRSVGCVIVDEYNSIITEGYNGSPSGMPHCKDVGCLIEGGHCVRAVHAEINAIAAAARRGASLKGARAYCTLLPCIQCAQALAVAGVIVVYFDEYYVRPEAATLMSLVGRLNLQLVERVKT